MTAALTLYHIAPSRSSIVRWMLEEVGEPYDLHLLDLAKEEQRSAAYLALNPMGKVPVLRHGDVVLTEAAAICCYLADAFSAAGLALPVGDRRRGVYLKWLFFGPSVLELAMLDQAFPRREPPPPTAIGWRGLDQVLEIVAAAVAAGPWLMGGRFTAADVVIGSGVRWGRTTGLVPARAELDAYVGRLEARPAPRRTTEQDAALAAARG